MQPESAPPPAAPSWTGTPAQEEGVLTPYVDAIRAHLWAVAALTLVAVVAAVVWTLQREPAYEASAELLVSPYPSGQVTLLGLSLLSQGNDPTRTIQTAAALVDSDDAATAAAARLGGDWTAKRVRNATEVTPLGETNILAVTATAASGDVAARIANAFTRAAIEVRSAALRRQAAAAVPGVQQQLESLTPRTPAADDLQRQLTLLRQLSTGQDPTLSISELAVPPAAPTGAPRWLILVLAALAGLILGIGAALLSESLAGELIRSEDQLLHLFPLPVLARIQNPASWRPRRGPRQVPTRVREAFRMVQFQLDMGGDKGRAIMLVSASPEEGKTPAAAAFAAELADSGTSVILVDADLRRRPVRAALAIAPNGSTPASSQTPLKGLLQEAPDRPSLKLLELGSLDDLGSSDGNRVVELIEQASKRADYVIIDTPPLGEASDALALRNAADDIVLVSELRKARRSDLETTRDLLLRANSRPTGVIIIRPRTWRAGGR